MWDLRCPTYRAMIFRVIKSFLFIIIIVVILSGGFFAGIYSYDYYHRWQGQKVIRDLANDMEKMREEEYARKMADTYGGSTPQETLQMFIDAVEAGDYELASRYFVESKREEWRGELEIAKNIDFLINSLKESQNNEGEYSIKKDSYSIHEPALTSFVVYPNGIWKLTEI